MGQLDLFPKEQIGEDDAYLTQQIITYIGNKRSLLPFIGKGLDIVQARLAKNKLVSLDLFSGSGIVARYLKQYSSLVIANDLENYSRISNLCYLTNKDNVDFELLKEHQRNLSRKVEGNLSSGFITELYSPRDEANITEVDRCFYTRRNAMFLDNARQAIEELPEEIKIYFLGPLLARASVHANTSGVFKGFYKNSEGKGHFGGTGENALTRILGKIELDIPVLSKFSCDSVVHQGDSNQVIDEIAEVDVAYLDPPYNQHPYGSNYFMLNLLADYKRPAATSRVSGIPTNWNRSRYNQKAEAEAALFELVGKTRAKYILISYNSEGFISYESFVSGLERQGKVTVLETSYNTFRGSRNLRERAIHVTEYLYLVEKN